MHSPWGDQNYNGQIQQRSTVERFLKLEKRKSKSHQNKDGVLPLKKVHSGKKQDWLGDAGQGFQELF